MDALKTVHECITDRDSKFLCVDYILYYGRVAYIRSYTLTQTIADEVEFSKHPSLDGPLF